MRESTPPSYDAPMSDIDSGVAWVHGVDVGATNIKFALVGHDGALVSKVQRRRTPLPCGPELLVNLVAERVERVALSRVAVGFPGEIHDGVVVRPGNLARLGTVDSPTDLAVQNRWIHFNLEDALRARTNRDVRVMNDAALAALGCCVLGGREVVLGLGTGLGLALSVDLVLTPVRDVGATLYADGDTYDERLGERARELDEARWLSDVTRVVGDFAEEFGADVVHLTGGNARRVSVSHFSHLSARVVVDGNEAPMHGAARLFRDEVRR